MTFARIVTHYFHHHVWLEDGELLRNADQLADIPTVLIHGRLDIGGPPDAAWLLARVWPAPSSTWCPPATLPVPRCRQLLSTRPTTSRDPEIRCEAPSWPDGRAGPQGATFCRRLIIVPTKRWRTVGTGLHRTNRDQSAARLEASPLSAHQPGARVATRRRARREPAQAGSRRNGVVHESVRGTAQVRRRAGA